MSETIAYAYRVTLTLIQNRKFRNATLRLLVRLYANLANPDHVNVVQCLIYLDEPEQVASVLETLLKNNNVLMAYQLGLDLYESATQQFLLKVKNLLRALITAQQPMEMGDEVKTEEAAAATTTTVAVVDDKSKVTDQMKGLIETLLSILNGEITITANMQFLIKNNHSDLLILKTIKVGFPFFFKYSLDQHEIKHLCTNEKDAVRNSICHTATVICNSFMHCGTTSDQFLRYAFSVFFFWFLLKLFLRLFNFAYLAEII